MKAWFVICGALLALASPAWAGERTENVYDRMAVRASEPHFAERMGESAKRLDEFAWLIGDWQVDVTVFASKSAPESTTQEKTTFRKFGDTLIADERLSTIVGFDPFAGRWFVSGFELPAAAFTPQGYADWDGKRMTFEGPARIGGEEFRFRQTYTRLGPDEFVLLNEQLQADGRFHPVDRYRYRRANAR